MRNALLLVRLAFVLVCATVLATVVWVARAPARAAPAAIAPMPLMPEPAVSLIEPTSLQIELMLRRASFTPESLAAAGLTGAQTTAIVEALEAHLIQIPGQIAQIDSQWASAKKQYHALRRLVQAGIATETQVQACQAARQAFENATQQRQAALGLVFAASTAQLTPAHLTTLQTIRQNARWKMPIEFLAVARDEAEWLQLREALANERISAKYGEEPDGDAQAFLAAARSQPEVLLASTNLLLRLPEVTDAWNDAVGPVIPGE